MSIFVIQAADLSAFFFISFYLIYLSIYFSLVYLLYYMYVFWRVLLFSNTSTQ